MFHVLISTYKQFSIQSDHRQTNIQIKIKYKACQELDTAGQSVHSFAKKGNS